MIGVESVHSESSWKEFLFVPDDFSSAFYLIKGIESWKGEVNR